MVDTLKDILARAYGELAGFATAYLPGIIAGFILLAASVLAAALVRRLLRRIIRAEGWERFLSQTGITDVLTRSGRIRVGRVIANTAYWVIVSAGVLLAVGAIDFALTARLFNAAASLVPKLLTGAAIVVVGAWWARYLGRSTLIWACNENLPYPRRLAMAVRALVTFTAVVVAAEHAQFARVVFVPAFLMIVGGLVLSVSISAGIAIQRVLRDRLSEPIRTEREECSSLWNHV